MFPHKKKKTLTDSPRLVLNESLKTKANVFVSKCTKITLKVSGPQVGEQQLADGHTVQRQSV